MKKRRRIRGTGRLYKRGAIWYISLPGQTAESTGKTACDEAETILKTRLREQATGVEYDPQSRKKLTIADLVQDLLQEYAALGKDRFRKDTKSRWEKHLEPFFGTMKASALGTDAMQRYRTERMLARVVDGKPVAGASNVTVNRELQILRRSYRLAAECDPPKVQRVPRFKFGVERNARKVFVDIPTMEKLKQGAACEGLWARVFVEMAFTFGWRRNELLSLTVANIDFLRGIVGLANSKNGDSREAPLTTGLRALLEALVAGKASADRLFPVRDIRYAWKRICDRAGAKAGRDGIVLHDARRSSARNKRAAGVSTSVIMDLQGWRSESMFRRYGIVDNSDRLSALEAETRYASDQLQKASSSAATRPN
jgi:integrase